MWDHFNHQWCVRVALPLVLALGACSSSPPLIKPTENTSAPAVSSVVNELIEEADIAKIDLVLTLTRELLLLAPDVARVNWKNKASPENKSQDESQLRAIEQAAILYQTDPALVRDYFQGLIEGDRYVQMELHKQWRSQSLPLNITQTRTPAQLKTASADLTAQLLVALSQIPALVRKKGAATLIEARAIEILPNRSALSEPTRRIVIAPLLRRATP